MTELSFDLKSLVCIEDGFNLVDHIKGYISLIISLLLLVVREKKQIRDQELREIKASMETLKDQMNLVLKGLNIVPSTVNMQRKESDISMLSTMTSRESDDGVLSMDKIDEEEV